MAPLHRAERLFLTVNAVPFVLTAVLSFTDVPGARLYGPFTIGLVWGVLQGVLFVATAWMYETRWSRPTDVWSGADAEWTADR
ncbi:hypothetical protein PZ61_0235545 [Streptomyces sp. MNU77]|uniref:hypothetical protein n=1 Tax=Streptomyces sp. MNU77 TaxID=1573406 RepID=UPI0009680CD8|nr:hypothetical protein [Streptomyces sp. MNU77]OLO25757.1 hypothetical protein PZ61_0235545 [Streptomyces sp. MNU77]